MTIDQIDGNSANSGGTDSHFINLILKTTPDIICIMDLHTRQVIYSNRDVMCLLGYTKEQASHMPNPKFDVMHPDDTIRMVDHLQRMKSIQSDDVVTEIEYRLKNANGKYTWFCERNSVFKRNSRGEPVEKIGICQDITLRKDQEEQGKTNLSIIQQSEELVTMGAWEYDIPTKEFKWSDGMYRLFEIEKDIKIEPKIYLSYSIESEREKVQELINCINRDFLPFEKIFTLVSPLKPDKIIRIKAIVQNNKLGIPLKVIGVDVDITAGVHSFDKINNLNEILVRKNKELHQLGDEIKTFNKIAANDYKETLQNLYTNLEYIINKDARNLSDSGRSNIRRAQSAIQRMNLLTEDINAYFALFDLKPQIVRADVTTIIRGIINSYKAKFEQYDVVVELGELPPIAVDASSFERLIENLFNSSIKLRNPAGSLNITIEPVAENDMDITVTSSGSCSYCGINFSANGQGLAEDTTDKIFDLFYLVSNGSNGKNLGIGFAMCKKIMLLHDGAIRAKTKPGQGMQIDCYFPLHENKTVVED